MRSLKIPVFASLSVLFCIQPAFSQDEKTTGASMQGHLDEFRRRSEFEKFKFEKEIAELNDKLEAALEVEEEKAVQQGDLDSVTAFQNERKIVKAGILPGKDALGTLAKIKTFRQVWREQSAQIREKYDMTRNQVRAEYIEKLKQLEVSLTKERKIEEARNVQKYREEFFRDDSTTNVAATNSDLLEQFRAKPNFLQEGWKLGKDGGIVGHPADRKRPQDMKMLFLSEVVASGSYELTVELTGDAPTKETIQAAITFPAGDGQATWLIGKRFRDTQMKKQNFGAVEFVKGLSASAKTNPMTYSPSPLGKGVRHTAQITVIDHDGPTVTVSVAIDGKELTKWTGNETDFTIGSDQWKTEGGSGRIGLGANFGTGSVTYHSAVLDRK